MVTESLSKAIDSLGKGEKSYCASAIEIYAQEIFSRVIEIDNAFKNMSITLEYLKHQEYQCSSYKFSDHHSFHIENFLLRLTSVVDRSYLLAGSTMLMENSKIERLGGKSNINKELRLFSSTSVDILSKMEQSIAHLRESRNQVAHQAGFSSKNICILQAIENSELESISVKKITDFMSYDEIKKLVIKEPIEDFERVLSVMDDLVQQLINSLSFVYSGVVRHT